MKIKNNVIRLIWFSSLIAMILFSSACRQREASVENRYVVLSPEVAEVIAALGGLQDIVGITEECNYPSDLKLITKVGKFGMLNKEAILALKPSIVFTSALEQDAITQELKKLGLRVEQIYPRSLIEMISEIRRVGTIIGKETEGKALADSIAAFLSTLKQSASARAKPRVYIEIYRDPLMSVSDASFVGELIENAGGDNIFAVLERDYARVKNEDVISAMPEIMICYSQDTLESIVNRKGWQKIPAIRNRRIYFEKDINPDLIQRAAPRATLGMARLREIFDQFHSEESR
ncbi:MAG: helical backbone metal receptor [Candidatus Cloacimonadaceae bacterium]|nr:helical backbone metal receptor [Candidatus Cloacimonadaceae bacterium]MDP3114841.1 helical backbone metal receptor [Candidatus Cloacimonadaceae bacterium]